MKEFFKRHETGLEVGDIRRFAKSLMEDLAPVLKDHEFVIRLFDNSEQESETDPSIEKALAGEKVYSAPETGKLYIPVRYDGRALALITVEPARGEALSPEAVELLPSVVRLSLDKILLYKIYITDTETGFNNSDYFWTFLKKKIENLLKETGGRGELKPLSLGDRETESGLCILLAEIRDYNKIATERGRLQAIRAFKGLGEWLIQEASAGACLARLDRARLGVILPGRTANDCQELARRLIIEQKDREADNLPPVCPAMGVVAFPTDFSDDLSSADLQASVSGMAEAIMAKAELALNQALTDRENDIYCFEDVLNHGGRVVQVLPYNRVVVNLGRVVGAREGQVFALTGADSGGTGQADFKGEVVLFDVQDDFSVGEVSNLRSSLTRVEPGDNLTLNKSHYREGPAGDPEDASNIDPVTGTPDHKGFIARLHGLTDAVEKFSLILVKVDGYDLHRKTMGNLESDRQFKALYDLLAEELLVEGGLAGRFSADSIIFFIPDMDKAGALTLAESRRDAISAKLRLTGSFGVSSYPCGPFTQADMVSNTQKALEHALFLGPASAAAFDSLSLNISGDKRFEAGDLDGAVDEYKKGLALNAEDLNILNSLGVCYGYQRRSDLAMASFDRVLELDPGNVPAHYNRGFALAMDNKPEEALECFRNAARSAPDNFDVLFHRGKMAFELDLQDEALETFARAEKLEDSRPIIYRYLGQALVRAEQKEKAIDAFKAAVRNDPEDALSLSQLGVLFLEKETDPEVALSLVRQSVDLDPTNGLFRHRLARALTSTGNLTEAEAEYRQTLDMGVRSREVYFELGLILRQLGQDEEAADFFRSSLDLDPEFKPAAREMEDLNPG